MAYKLINIKEFFISHEPKLSVDEKKVMWKNIINSTLSYKPYKNVRLKPFFFKMAAAVIVILVISGAILYMRNLSQPLPLESSLAKLDVTKCNNTTIVFGDNTMTFGRRCTVKCLPKQNVMEITDGTAHILLKNNNIDDDSQLFSIAVSDQSRANVILSDGTEITMREGSKMSFPYNIAQLKQRKVSIDGEAYFSVHHDVSSPFTVLGRGLTVNVLGTQFMLSSYSRNVERKVTLISGAVLATTDNGDHVILKPGQTFSYNSYTKHTTMKMEQDAMSVVDWKDDIINLGGQTLNVIMQKISKIYSVHFHFVDNKVNDICLSGKLDAHLPIDELLDNLSKIAPINIVKKDKNTYNIMTKK
jgi:transmembrane sensor